MSPRARAAAVVGLRLGPPGSSAGLRLRRFVRYGGDAGPVTPTEVRLAWDADALYAVFRCTEPNPRYRPLRRSDYDRGAAAPQFADCVAFHVRPDWSSPRLVIVTVASSGDTLAEELQVNVPDSKPRPLPADGFTTEVRRGAKQWQVRIALRWATLGCPPGSAVGLNLFRMRGQSSERLSLVPVDFWGRPAPDLCAEVQFGGAAGVIAAPGTWAALPSGVGRWQPPAVLAYPAPATRRAIAGLQERLPKEPTTPAALPRRVALAQAWLDLLVLEGFSFHPNGGCWDVGPGERQPDAARRAVNAAARRDDAAAACAVLDGFLRQLDRATRAWFADGSPGNLRDAAWQAVTRVTAARAAGGTVRLDCRAGARRLALTLSAPGPESLRIRGQVTGVFAAGRGEPLALKATAAGWRLEGAGLQIAVDREPFAIRVRDRRGRQRFELRPGALRGLAPAGGRGGVDLALPLARGEVLFGFGERFEALNQRGRVLTVHDLDAWEGLFYTLPNQSYKPIQLFHSSRGYSAFLNSTGLLRVDAGHADAARLRLTQHGPGLDLWVWCKPPLEALADYTALTGRPLQPPAWAFEPWMGAGWERWKTGPCRDSAREIRTAAERFAELGIPHAAVYAEGEAMDDPRTTAWLEPMGLRTLSWMNSTLSGDEQAKRLPGTPKRDLPLVRRADGKAFPYIDFTHPNALRLTRAFWKHRLDMGVAGSMVDFGDMVPEDARFHDGRRGVEMHNFYAYDYHRLFAQAFRERRGDDFVLFCRSAAPGSQRWLCQFAGDHQSNFIGLANALRGGLTLSASGFSTWGCDIGGYLGWPDPETYIRWVQWGCFSPLMRCHGTRPREPWEYGEEAVACYRFYAWLRMSLGDYLRSTAAEATRTGAPFMRALPLAFPGQPRVADCDDAYLLGPDLLVAPMHAPGLSRTVPLPAGRWTCLWTGAVYAGGTSAKLPAPLDRIPVLLRAGAAVPLHLNAELALGGSLGRTRQPVWLLTPPARAEVREFESLECGSTRVELRPAGRGFRATLQGRAEARTVLLAGVRPTRIRADGQDLPRLSDAAQRDAHLCGWWQEPGRAVIRLPHRPNHELLCP